MPEYDNHNQVSETPNMHANAAPGRAGWRTALAGAMGYEAQSAALSPNTSTAFQCDAGPETFAEQTVDLSADPELAAVQTAHPEGITISLYANYPSESEAADKNNREFPTQATGAAEVYAAVSMVGDTPVLGQPIPILSRQDIQNTVNGIYTGLQRRYEAVKPANAPARVRFTRVKNLMIFAHGYSRGINLPGSDMHNDNIEDFVSAMSLSLLPDVNVQLYACSTADGGETSYAAGLAEELGDQASVFGHTSVAHTTENHQARVFGARAGGAAEGAYMRDILCPESFISAEMARIWGPLPDETVRAAARQVLLGRIDYFYGRTAGLVGGWTHDLRKDLQDDIPGVGYYARFSMMGREMFADPDNAASLSQTHFQPWVATQQRSLAGAAPVLDSFSGAG
ncbi:MAG: hypothetical protein ACI9WU_005132 [Myxococcota bacterium]|jgi:hypothetical protein